TTQQLPRFFAAGLFVFSPPMIWRLHGHMSLVGHFLILAALYLSLRRTEANRRIWWTALVTAAALVHAYIFAMVGLLWLANLAHVLLTRRCTIRASAME